MLMAAELRVPQHVFVHGFLLGADGRKMSKSLGNVLDPFEVIDEYGTDALRFYLMRDVAFGGDGAVGMDAVASRYETELANEYGNLASRTIAMIAALPRRRRSRRSRPTRARGGLRRAAASEVAALMDRAEATQALELIWQRVRRLNRYVEERAPWQLAKDPADAAALDETLASLAEGLRVGQRAARTRTCPRAPSGCSMRWRGSRARLVGAGFAERGGTLGGRARAAVPEAA